MAENRIKMLARLKEMRRKAGIGEFRRSARKIVTKSRSVQMARGRRFYRSVRRGVSSRSNMSLDSALCGLGASIVAKKFLGNNDLIAGVASYWKGGVSGVVASAVVGTVNINGLNLNGLLGGMGSSSSNGSSTVTYY